MAMKCDICGKGPAFGNNVSHAHNKLRRRWNPNLQSVKVSVKGQTKRLKACTRCVRSGATTKAA
ncbi:MAG: 50S ribosomal protein L28 [Deltaproteobacteria bacterium]|jgi:large subunit ribosomal protein L28|nr:50S ribosomal protein L28 [Deltaproteobacteria bacterium]NOS35687.1 50S ribosomal protein L28 [Deltaproteobacteria bacterium]